MQIHEEGWGERMARALAGEPDDGSTPGPHEAPRVLVLAWWLWFVAIVAIVAAALMLSGCASTPPVPLCAKWNATAVTDDEGGIVGVLVDADGIRKLHALVQGLAAGTCRLPKPGTPV